MPQYFKSNLRQTLKKIRKNLSPDYQEQASKKITAQILTHFPCRQAKRIALYQAIDGEVDMQNIWHWASLHEKLCYFPAVTPDKTLTFLPATTATPSRKNRYGITEPAVDFSEAINVQNIDIMFVPLVAFDRRGTRLGMGAGYYDRTLTQQKPGLLIGVAYDFQYQSLILPEDWDIPMQAIITPTQLYWSP